ncbi:unannotated protein [freshwater metagenome]|uniref:Unannotated protein n=1 Tax=freshwater metagenome TaxID=449393 RepID=A0A6J7EEB1_9ZZZZ|nr:hypothetical protein [Actinomycetota bacterium]
MASVLSFLAIAGGCVFLLWIAYRMEPHWVSKDGERMVCYGQGLGRNGQADARWREVRVAKVSNDTLEIRPRRGGITSTPRREAMANPRQTLSRRRRAPSYWKVIGRSDTPPRRRVVFLLDGNHDPDMPEMFALRLPPNSRAIPLLEALAANRSSTPTARPNPETPRSADRPDRG